MDLDRTVGRLRHFALTHANVGATDGELLGQYVRHQDEEAFTLLVRRHGPLVWGVCRRLLTPQDAEDAFQAVFMVLVRKAGSIRKADSLASWLHGVAHRTAMMVRRTEARRRATETRAMLRAVTPDGATDLSEVLDQELSCLPGIYRAAILLCDLEGKSHRAAAKKLGCPEGTLASRLVRGRRMLAQRLNRRGITLSGGAVAMWMSQEAGAGACVPASLLSTVADLAAGRIVASPAIATLTQGVLKMMLVSKLKVVAGVVLLIGSLAVAVAAAVGQVPGEPSLDPLAAQNRVSDAKADSGLTDAEFIRKVCLELRGSPPSDIEVHYFLQDRNPEKRKWIVDMLRREGSARRNANAEVQKSVTETQLSTPKNENQRLRNLIAGRVTKIDATGRNLMSIDVGSDDGVQKGDTFYVYRLQPEAVYLGEVTVLEVQPQMAIARRISAMARAVQVGDIVSNNLKQGR